MKYIIEYERYLLVAYEFHTGILVSVRAVSVREVLYTGEKSYKRVGS